MNAVFLDRDGTLIVDPPDYRVDSIDEISLFSDSISALSKLSNLDYGVFIISNQAGIGEGRYSIEEFTQINNKVIKLLEKSGVKIIKTFFCPHKSDENCICRKPMPTLLQRAANEFDINLEKSWMVGDRQSDIQAGINAGTRTILVKTANFPVNSKEATYTAENLDEAINYIASN